MNEGNTAKTTLCGPLTLDSRGGTHRVLLGSANPYLAVAGLTAAILGEVKEEIPVIHGNSRHWGSLLEHGEFLGEKFGQIIGHDLGKIDWLEKGLDEQVVLRVRWSGKTEHLDNNTAGIILRHARLKKGERKKTHYVVLTKMSSPSLSEGTKREVKYSCGRMEVKDAQVLVNLANDYIAARG